MSALANGARPELIAGLSNFSVDTELIDRVNFYMREGFNQLHP
jgi:hypothetical protein